ncbi:MAG: cytidine deaminase [Acidobacteriota bacterium]
MDWEALVTAASEARRHAYAPYSGFQVGAAVLADGDIHSGCNVENRSYGLALCAERLAVASAAGAGARHLEALVVLAEAEPPARPCGPCLQVLTEFADPDLPILLCNTRGARDLVYLRDLLPQPFRLPRAVDP